MLLYSQFYNETSRVAACTYMEVYVLYGFQDYASSTYTEQVQAQMDKRVLLDPFARTRTLGTCTVRPYIALQE